jgi:hypothetical protein
VRASREVEGSQVGLKLNETDQLLVCADNINLLEDNLKATKKNTEAPIDARKEVGLRVNRQK